MAVRFITVGEDDAMLESSTFVPFGINRYHAAYGAQVRFLRRSGFDGVRLCVSWKGIEPTRGTYNMEYLEAVIQTVRDIRIEAGIPHILLAFDQREYGTFTGGAGIPAWAVPDRVLLTANRTCAWEHFWKVQLRHYTAMVIYALQYTSSQIPKLWGVQPACNLRHADCLLQNGIGAGTITAEMQTDFYSLHATVLAGLPSMLQGVYYIMEPYGMPGVFSTEEIRFVLNAIPSPPVQFMCSVHVPWDGKYTPKQVQLCFDGVRPITDMGCPVFYTQWVSGDTALDMQSARARAFLSKFEQADRAVHVGWSYSPCHLFPVGENSETRTNDGLWSDTLVWHMKHDTFSSFVDPVEDEEESYYTDTAVSSRYGGIYWFWVFSSCLYLLPCMMIHAWGDLITFLLLVTWLHLMLNITSEICPPGKAHQTTLQCVLLVLLIADAVASMWAGLIFLTHETYFSLWCGTTGIFWGFMGSILGCGLGYARRGTYMLAEHNEAMLKHA